MEPVNGGIKKSPFTNFSTHEPLFRQGHVGDLQSKSEIEIKELLERQKKLLSNRQFISKLPDGGNKIQQFVLTLQDCLHNIENEEHLIVNEVDFNDTTSSVSPNENHSNETKEFPQVKDEESSANGNEVENDLSVIEKGFSNLAIHEGPHYDVIKKASERPKQSKFKLNRLKTSKPPSEAPSTTLSPDKGSSEMINNDPVVAPRKNHDISAATIRDPKAAPVMISIEECRTLHTKQEAVEKEQRSQLLADRIASKYMSSEFLTPNDQLKDHLSYDVSDDDAIRTLNDDDDLDDID